MGGHRDRLNPATTPGFDPANPHPHRLNPLDETAVRGGRENLFSFTMIARINRATIESTGRAPTTRDRSSRSAQTDAGYAKKVPDRIELLGWRSAARGATPSVEQVGPWRGAEQRPEPKAASVVRHEDTEHGWNGGENEDTGLAG